MHVSNGDFILDLAFLADTTALLNEFNLELQGKDKYLNELSNKRFAFKIKIFLLSL